MFGINDRYSKPGRQIQAQQNEDLVQLQFSRAFDRAAAALLDRAAPSTALPPPLLITADNFPGDPGLPDNYQPVESAWYIPGPTALIDGYSPDENTTGTLVVDDANHVIAACDTPGDNDWFAVTLTAGVTYQFGQYAYAGGLPGVEGNGVPLADAYLEIYDSAGNLLSIADGGGPNTPSGLDALMTFEAPSSGTFYVNATSYDNDGDGVGDFAGDYEIFARTATGTTYTTHYDISSPLHSIDWGGVLVNREHVSVRNPDGMEGPRPTGEPPANPADVEGNALGHPGKNVIYLYFAGEGDLYANADSTIPAQVVIQNPYQYEIQAMLTAANEFSKVADVVFVSNYTLNTTTGLYERDPTIEYKPGPLGPEAGVKYAAGVDDGFDADFFYFSYPGTPGPVISLLGSMSPPDYGDEGVAQFNSADERWNAQMLQPGGFSFVTLIHEFGHGMGLAHPHDTGGGSSIMQGVNPSGVPGDDGGAGAFDLNQGVNTMMSYNDGWEKSPYGQAETNNEGYGWLGSLMALDIAVIQDKYGVNEDWAIGNNSYVLKDVNEWGVYIDAATGQPAVHDATNQATARDGYYVGQSTYYSSIWDAGGVDQITYSGARDANIDLRAATLQYEYGGAGWMSYASGIFGGFTIANGVTIENASSGSGKDRLTGNIVANLLDGGAGDDLIDGGAGDDTLRGAAGKDTLTGGIGADTMEGGADDDTYFVDNVGDRTTEAAGQGYDVVAAAITYTLTAGASIELMTTGFIEGIAAINLTGNELANQIWGNAAANTLTGADGNDELFGFGGADNLVGGNGDDAFFGGAGAGDTLQGGLGIDTYFIDDAADIIVEVAGEGRDVAAAAFDYALGAGVSVELMTTGWIGGTATIALTGNEIGNEIWGNDGANALLGGGGNAFDALIAFGGNDRLDGGGGFDLLVGGTGQDSFAFTSALVGADADLIADFSAADDTILLDDAVFAGLAPGALNANAFVLGTAALDADDRILYDAGTGKLYFDADGNGAGAAVQFATLSGNPVLTASDFQVI